MRAWLALLATVALTPGCHEKQQTGGAGAASGAPMATSNAPKLPAPPAAPDVRGNPMTAYSPEAVSKYDAPAACHAACVAGLRCRIDLLFKDGSREVPAKLTRCKKACTGDHAKQPGYLEKAKSCLTSADCASFGACAASVLPAKL